MPADRARRRLRHVIRIAACASGIVMAVPSAASACAVEEQTAVSGRAVCTIESDMSDGPADAGGLRLEARFEGFHDDSLVDMALRLDGADVQCRPQDRLELSGESGEEGEVTLFCSFRVGPSGGQRRTLIALLRFRHAGLSSVRLVPEPQPTP